MPGHSEPSRYIFTPVAEIHTPLGSKFGVPRQAGLARSLPGRVVFAPPFRDVNALRGLDGFSHLWLVWVFSESVGRGWSPTVRPPRLGGNERRGVFATRSPFRPNPIALSCVQLEGIEWDTQEGPVLHVSGVDMMDGTPILDIKPYVPYADAHPEAIGGFAAAAPAERLAVVYAPGAAGLLSEAEERALSEVLGQDPRPRYQNDPAREYGLDFAGCAVRFRVENTTVQVIKISKKNRQGGCGAV